MEAEYPVAAAVISTVKAPDCGCVLGCAYTRQHAGIGRANRMSKEGEYDSADCSALCVLQSAFMIGDVCIPFCMDKKVFKNFGSAVDPQSSQRGCLKMICEN